MLFGAMPLTVLVPALVTYAKRRDGCTETEIGLSPTAAVPVAADNASVPLVILKLETLIVPLSLVSAYTTRGRVEA